MHSPSSIDRKKCIPTHNALSAIAYKNFRNLFKINSQSSN